MKTRTALVIGTLVLMCAVSPRPLRSAPGDFFPGRNVDMESRRVVNLGAPVASTDAARRSEVEAKLDSFPGAIVAYGGTSAPSGWILCDGAAVSRSTFAALFAVLGTAYGAGNGSTTFNLPDLRQRFPLGLATAGTGSTLGGTGGAVDHTHGIGSFAAASESTHSHGVGSLAAASESAHTHSFTPNSVNAQTPITPVSVGNDTAATTGPGSAHTHTLSGTSGAGSAHTHTLSGVSGTENPPFQTVNYIVKT